MNACTSCSINFEFIKNALTGDSNNFIYRYRVAFFAVYDGHGGARASRFASKNLHKFLLDKFPKGNVPPPPSSFNYSVLYFMTI
jgi:serine/threonine protein phosphatase PrpC